MSSGKNYSDDITIPAFRNELIIKMEKKIIALVGLPASGKSLASRFLQKKGFRIVRLGDVTDEEIKKRGLELNEENENIVRQELRNENGMACYAKLNLERIKEGGNVIIDGIRSYEELELFRKEFGETFMLVAVETDPELRYSRLEKRKIRPLTREECMKRDERELDVLGVRKTVEHADKIIRNEGSLDDFRLEIESLI